MDNSPLRKLSPELRNTIAEMALYHEEGIIIAGKHEPAHASAFAQTCKEMQQDYAGLYYLINTFKYIAQTHGFMYEIESYGDAIGAINVDALGSVIVILTIPADMKEGGIVSAIQELDTGGNKSTPPGPKLAVAELRLKLDMDDGYGCREYSIRPNALRDSSGSLRAASVSLSDELDLRLDFSQLPPSITKATAVYYIAETLELLLICYKLRKATKQYYS